MEQDSIKKQTQEHETELFEGAKMLETPPDGDFIAGIRRFVEWVSKEVAKDK